jgi:hypothetical protein
MGGGQTLGRAGGDAQTKVLFTTTVVDAAVMATLAGV